MQYFFAIEKGLDGKDKSMMHIIVENYQVKKYLAGVRSPKTKHNYKHFNKAGHEVHRCVKPFFRALIAAINGGESSIGEKNY